MNWQTKEIIDEARNSISDECVFTSDQITALTHMIDRLEGAIEKESKCVSSNCVSISHR